MMEELRLAFHYGEIQQPLKRDLGDSPSYYQSSPNAQDYLSNNTFNLGSNSSVHIKTRVISIMLKSSHFIFVLLPISMEILKHLKFG